MQTDLLISVSPNAFSSKTPMEDNSSALQNLVNIFAKEKIFKMRLIPDRDIKLRVWTSKEAKIDSDGLVKALVEI
jgi:hypothetical protein